MEERDQPWNFHTCKFCPYRSKSTLLMCYHVRLHRDRSNTDFFACESETPEMYECESCEFDADSQVCLQNHINVVHGGKEENSALGRILGCYRCKKCNFQTYSLLVVTKHVNNCVRVSPNQTKTAPRSESVTVEDTKWFKCEQCDGKFKTKTFLKIHCESKHATTPEDTNCFKCEHCLYRTKREDRLRQHVLSCRFVKKFKSIRAKDTEALAKHVEQKRRWKTKGKPRNTKSCKCEQCDIKFIDCFKLKRHFMLKHAAPEDISWFNCDYCPYKARRKDYLKRHSLGCSSIKKLICGYCSFKAKNKESLINHVKRNHRDNNRGQVTISGVKAKQNIEGAKRFKCEHCDSDFKTSLSLNRHMLKHAAPEATNWFKCNHCCYQTERKDCLQKHKKKCESTQKTRQDGESVSVDVSVRFKCEQCDGEFKSSILLNIHIKSKHVTPEDINHQRRDCLQKLRRKSISVQELKQEDESGTVEDTRWYKCAQCDRKFKASGHLKRHFMQKHTAPEDIVWFKCEYCPFKAKRKDNLKQHSLKCSTIQKLRCSYCQVKAKTKLGLTKHMKLKHSDVNNCNLATPEQQQITDVRMGTSPEDINYFKCDFCPYKTDREFNLKKHRLSCSSAKEIAGVRPPQNVSKTRKRFRSTVKRYKCEHCDSRFIDRYRLKRHFNARHAAPEDITWFKCDYCVFKTKRKDTLKEHSKKCESFSKDIRQESTVYTIEEDNEKDSLTETKAVEDSENYVTSTVDNSNLFLCNFCGRNFKRRSALLQHISLSHLDRKDIKWWHCQHCSYKTKRKHYLKVHILRHDGSGEFRCVHCAYIAKVPEDLRIHVKRMHSNNFPKFQCVHCPYMAKFPSDLRKHVNRRHSDDSKARRNLKKHILLDHAYPTDAKRWNCGQCSFKTKDKNYLKRHILTHNPVKSFNCVHCTFKSTAEEDVRKHVRLRHRHNSELLQEQLCDQKYKWKRSLQPDVLLNQGGAKDVEWWNCGQCSFKTKYKDYLRQHTLRHGSLRRFECTYCIYKAKVPEDVRKHMRRLHSNSDRSELFQCQLCDLKYKWRDSLKRHVSLKHANPQ